MQNISSLIASSMTAITVSLSIVSVLFLLGAILFIWWVDTKKRPFKEFLRVIGDKFVLFWGEICNIFHFSGTVKTVYSDKTLNYSGTEFLPIPTKAPTNQYSYEFVGWDKNGIDENGNIVYEWVQKKDENGTPLLDENDDPIMEQVPVKEQVTIDVPASIDLFFNESAN